MAGIGLEMLAILKIQKCMYVEVGFEYYIPALAAVSAVRTAIPVVSVTIHTVAAVSAVAGLDIDLRFIYEHLVLSVRPEPVEELLLHSRSFSGQI